MYLLSLYIEWKGMLSSWINWVKYPTCFRINSFSLRYILFRNTLKLEGWCYEKTVFGTMLKIWCMIISVHVSIQSKRQVPSTMSKTHPDVTLRCRAQTVLITHKTEGYMKSSSSLSVSSFSSRISFDFSFSVKSLFLTFLVDFLIPKFVIILLS